MAFVLIICNGIPEPPKFNKQSNERCAPFPLLFETRRRPPKHEKRYGKRKTVPNERFPHGETHQGRTDAAGPKHHLVGPAGGLLARESIQGVSPQVDLHRPSFPNQRSLGLRLLQVMLRLLPSKKM